MTWPQSDRQLAATVRAAARRAAQRAMVAAAWRGASVALAAGGVVSLAWVALSRAWAIGGSPVEWMLWAPAGIGAVGAVAWAFLRRWSIARAAREVDARLGLRDALSSALSLSERSLVGTDREFAMLAIADAEAVAARANIAGAVPMPRARQWAGWAAAGVIAITAAWEVSERWPGASSSREVVVTKEQTQSAQSVVAQAKAVLQQLAAQSESAASGALDGRAADAMSQVERELAAGTMSPREAAVSAAEELQASADKMEEDAAERERSSEEVQDALRALRERASKASDASRQSELGKAIADGDATRAAEEIAKLQDRLADLPADERERVAKELEDLAAQAKEAARGGSGESPSESTEAGNSDDIGDAMKQAADEIRRGEKGERRGDERPEKPVPDQSVKPGGIPQQPQAAQEPAPGEKRAPDPGGKAPTQGPKEGSGARPDVATPPKKAPSDDVGATPKSSGEAPTANKPVEEGADKKGQSPPQSPVSPSGIQTPLPQPATGEKQQRGEQGKSQQGARSTDKGSTTPRQKQGASDPGSKEQAQPRGEKQQQGKQGEGNGGGQSEQTNKPGPDERGEAGKDSSTPPKPEGDKPSAPRPGGKEGAGAKEQGESNRGGEPGGGKSSGGSGQSEEQRTPGMEELRRAMKNASEGKKSAAQSREQAERLREQARRALEQLKPQEREELQRLAQEMKKSPAGGGQGVVPNDNPGEAPGSRPGALPDGSGRGTVMTAAPGDEDVVRVRGGDGGASQRTLAEWLAKPTKGASAAEPTLSGALQDAAAGAERAVEQQTVPSRHAEYLKRVYKRYRERAAETAPPAKN